MATYVFSCRDCGASFELSMSSIGEQPCAACGKPTLRRDYRAENVGFSIAAIRGGGATTTNAEMRDLFLPKAEEFAGPDDPDGSKGLDKWNESHEPAESNTNPIRPERPLHAKKVF